MASIQTHVENLPIYPFQQDILTAIDQHQVTIISGETGSGKTTQVPQYLLYSAAEQGNPIRIICTEPRRIAAVSVSERVAQETGTKFGDMVGYQIRLENFTSPNTLLTFCTNGVLLRTLMGGTEVLNTITHIIVDEIHERDKFSDFLITVLRDALKALPHLRLVLMSATMDSEMFK
jgi:HrpA-like RNA helicase